MASLDLTPWQSLLACCRPPAPARARTRDADNRAAAAAAAAKGADGASAPATPATVADADDVSLGDAPGALYCDDDVPDMSYDGDDVPDIAAARDDGTPRAAHDAPHITLYRCMAMLLLRHVFGSWLFGRWRVTKAMLSLSPPVESGTRRSDDADEGAGNCTRLKHACRDVVYEKKIKY